MNGIAQPSADWAGNIRQLGIDLGASSRRHYCRLLCRCAPPNGDVGHQSCLDGDGMSSECPAVCTHTLSFHGAILPGHDHSRSHSCFGNRFGRFMRMACAWRRCYFRQQDHLVGDRAGVGKILVDYLAHLLCVCFCSASPCIAAPRVGAGGADRHEAGLSWPRSSRSGRRRGNSSGRPGCNRASPWLRSVLDLRVTSKA
jgi:hypothetical protein